MEFIIWIALSIAAVVPLFKLLPHFGVKEYWAFVAIIMPIGMIVLLWVMAMKLQELEKR